MYLIYDSKTKRRLVNVIYSSEKEAEEWLNWMCGDDSYTRKRAEGRYSPKVDKSALRTLKKWERAVVKKVKISIVD